MPEEKKLQDGDGKLLHAMDVKTAHAQGIVDDTYRHLSWRLLPFLMLCYVLYHIDRINVGFAHLQMKGDIGLSDAAFGLGVAAAAVATVSFGVPSNLMLVRIGMRKTLSRIMVLWGIAAAATAFARTPGEFVVARFFLGMFEAGLIPGVTFYLTLWYPSARRARVLALLAFSFVIAGVLVGPVSGLMMAQLDGTSGMRGWQWMLILQGLPACMVGIVAYYYLSDGPRDARWLNPVERDVVEHNLAEDHRLMDAKHDSTLRDVLRDRRVYVLSAINFTLVFATGALGAWLPVIIGKLGIKDVVNIGLLSALPYLAGGVAMVLWGRHSDQTLERRWHFALPVLIAVAGFAMLAQGQGQQLVGMTGLVLAGMGLLASLAPFWTVPMALLKGPAAALAIAIVNSVGILGGALSALFIGQVMSRTGRLDLAFYPVMAVLIASAATMLLAVPRHAIRERVPD